MLQAQSLKDFLMPMLHFDPLRRISAAGALRHPWLSSEKSTQLEYGGGKSYESLPRESIHHPCSGDHYARSKSRDVARHHGRSSSPSPR